MTEPALTLDHAVIMVADLERAIADYTALGFSVQRGGTHAAGTTHNALVGFVDGSYLELIAFLRQDPTHRWGAHAARGHQGFVDFALWPPRIDAVIDRVRAAGVAYRGPVDGGRTRPDGAVLRWQIGLPPSPELPFLCADLTPRALRVPGGDLCRHPNGVSGVASITVQVRDLSASVARYGTLLGRGPQAPTEPHAGSGRWPQAFALGSQRLLLTTRDGSAPADLAEGLLALSLRGPRPASWSRDRTQGAAIDVEPG